MYIYLVCSVRDADEESKRIADEYVAKLEAEGHQVHHPPRDVDQDSETGLEIVEEHFEAMKKCDEVHFLWNPKSFGSHMDLGMAVGLGKKLVPVQIFGEDDEGKSYWKVMNLWNDRGTKKEVPSKSPTKTFRHSFNRSDYNASNEAARGGPCWHSAADEAAGL